MATLLRIICFFTDDGMASSNVREDGLSTDASSWFKGRFSVVIESYFRDRIHNVKMPTIQVYMPGQFTMKNKCNAVAFCFTQRHVGAYW